MYVHINNFLCTSAVIDLSQAQFTHPMFTAFKCIFTFCIVSTVRMEYLFDDLIGCTHYLSNICDCWSVSGFQLFLILFISRMGSCCLIGQKCTLFMVFVRTVKDFLCIVNLWVSDASYISISYILREQVPDWKKKRAST